MEAVRLGRRAGPVLYADEGVEVKVGRGDGSLSRRPCDCCVRSRWSRSEVVLLLSLRNMFCVFCAKLKGGAFEPVGEAMERDLDGEMSLD